jgi:hypothetical protein
MNDSCVQNVGTLSDGTQDETARLREGERRYFLRCG